MILKRTNFTEFNTKINTLISKTDENYYAIIFLLIDWDLDKNVDGKKNRLLPIIQNLLSPLEFKKFMVDFFHDLLEVFQNNDVLKECLFKSRSSHLSTTVNGHQCQTWGSNKVHYEGGFKDFFSYDITLNPEGYKWDDLNGKNGFRIKRAIRDGLLDKVGDRWVPNNKCRNPNNSKTAPWCYTTNPKVRWDYCMKPDFTVKSKTLILIFLMFFLLFLSYYFVKIIFRYKLLEKFIDRLTGNSSGSGTTTSQ